MTEQQPYEVVREHPDFELRVDGALKLVSPGA
jgi:hypothetical protein